MKNTIAITGATGFIGKQLIAELLREGGSEIKVLFRNREKVISEEIFGRGVEICEGDISDPDSLKVFLVAGCTVVHLAYPSNAGAALNQACTNNLLEACKNAKVAHLVHCSNSEVIGRAQNNLVDERTPSFPIDEYGTTKFK